MNQPVNNQPEEAGSNFLQILFLCIILWCMLTSYAERTTEETDYGSYEVKGKIFFNMEITNLNYDMVYR